MLAFGLALTACGFHPVYKVSGQNYGNGVPVLAALAVPDSANGRALSAALRGRWQSADDALFAVRLTLSETARDGQFNAAGVPQRVDIEYQLGALITRMDDGEGRGQSTSFVLRHSESMTRSDSGAADLTQRRSLARLAMQALADRLVLRLSREMAE